MSNFDDLKLAVESLSGGKNTVLFDDLGMPSIMVRIPKFKLSDVIEGADQEIHPAFKVDNAEKDFIYISKYQNIVVNDRAYSLPYKDPKHTLTFDQAKTYCENKGTGWHLMTNAEWAAIALWCKKNDTMPRGNNNYGSDVSAPHEKGVTTYVSGGNICRVATGSGPATWSHDWTNEGVFDLNGNVYEWVGGLRLLDGEIQIIPYNDAAMQISQSPTSTLWKAILADGSLVDPGTAGTLKFDYTIANPTAGTASFHLTDTLVNQQATDTPYGQKAFEALTAKDGLTAPMILKALGIYPVDASHGGDLFYFRNNGERCVCRGGDWYDAAGAGVFSLYAFRPRSGSRITLGFRSAFVL